MSSVNSQASLLNRQFVPEAAQEGDARRKVIAEYYLYGEGLEIGALNKPLPLPATAKARYVDRLSVADLREQYPNLEDEPLREPDIVDDGETLSTVADFSQDFVISSHLIEHCEDPIRAFGNWLRVLKVGGVMYLGVPDMRFTADRDREVTSIEHLLRDHREGPAWSRRQHFMEWVTQVDKATERIEEYLNYLLELNYSIHFHAWTQAELFELLVTLKREFNFDFDVIASFQNGIEIIFILKKIAPEPHPDLQANLQDLENLNYRQLKLNYAALVKSESELSQQLMQAQQEKALLSQTLARFEQDLRALQATRTVRTSQWVNHRFKRIRGKIKPKS